MSHTPNPSQTPDTSSQTVNRPRPSVDFLKLDERIRHLSDRILPKQPYLVTIPSDFPYRRHRNDPNRWWLNTPFTSHEEQLQYMSLLPHQDDSEDLLKIEGSRVDDDGNLSAYAHSPPRSEYTSRPETPILNDAPREKKKISLKDYQTKDKSALNTPDPRQADEIRRQAIKGHKEDVAAKIDQHANKLDDKLVSNKPATKTEAVQPPAQPVSDAPRASVTKQDVESQRLVKKRKLSSENMPASARDNVPSDLKKEQHQASKPLPALLSPTIPAADKKKSPAIPAAIPAADKKQKPRELPGFISPILPVSLEHALSTPARDTPQHHRTEDVKAIIRSGMATPVPTDKKAATSTKKDDVTGRIRSDSQLSNKSALGIPKVSSPAVKALPATASKTTTALVNGGTASPKVRQRRIICLKYGKKNRKRVESLLRFAPRTKKSIPQPDDKTPGLASKSTTKTDPPKIEKKRPTEEVSEAPPKKQKVASSTLEVPKTDRPATPKTLATNKSPVPDNKSKLVFSTPKKEPKSAALERVASTDTVDDRTPRQEVARTSTPILSSQSQQPGPSPGAAVTPARPEDRVAWGDFSAKIHELGRTLKKQGPDLSSDSDGKKRILGAAVMVESLLCFMVYFAAQSYVRPNASDAGWTTIIPYLNQIRGLVKTTAHAKGLVMHLTAVVRQHIHQEHLRKLAREPLPDDQSTSAPTPGSDGTARTDDPEKNKQRYLDFRKELVYNARDLQQAWIDGAKFLSLATIEDHFKETWRKRRRDTSRRVTDKLNPKDLPKDFYLPLDPTTTAFEAASFAIAFLTEWTKKEGVDWKPRSEL